MSHITFMPKRKNETPPALSPLDATWYGTRFASDFIYDRPFGTGDDAIHFFHFRNEVVLLDEEGSSPREPGSAVIYLPDAPQKFQGIASSDKPLRCDHVCFPANTKDRLKQLAIPFNRVFTITHPQPVMDSIVSLRTEERKAQPHWRTAIRAYRTILILQLAREATQEQAAPLAEQNSRSEQVIRDVCAMIDRNPANPWVVAELAKMVGMSRGRFTALFKQVAGTAPQDYAIKARLHEACVLLTNTSLSVSQIADRCGFRSAYYLSRLFSQRIGCPPSRYAERFQVAGE